MTQPNSPEVLDRQEWLDRNQSILAFNSRVLDLATRPEIPLLERVRYLTIVASNLDEFFEVRGYDWMQEDRTSSDDFAHILVAEQYRIYQEVLIPELKKNGIRILSHRERSDSEKAWISNYFLEQIKPVLIPVALDPSHPFPQVANKSLNFIVRLGGEDAFGRSNEIAIFRIPRSLPRIIQLPNADSSQDFVFLSSAISANLESLFPGRSVLEFSQFRVTRNSELSIEEDDVRNLRATLILELSQRNFGRAVRLEVSSKCSEFLVGFLTNQFELPEKSVFRVDGPPNLVRLSQLLDFVDRPELFHPTFQPRPSQKLIPGQIFSTIRQNDIVIHQPFDSFDSVLNFLAEAADDPDVVSIKQTIYRLGSESPLVPLLLRAIQNGKDVTVVVELKARFDEETNIQWANELERKGAQVVFGVVGLKTHAKMLLITRRIDQGFEMFAHLSTGNYNARTAKLYTDIGFFTADKAITSDVNQVFGLLANQSHIPQLEKLVVAPFRMQDWLLEKLKFLQDKATAGHKCKAILKMNALTDDRLAIAIAKACLSGVKIDLIVRGACILPPAVPGFTQGLRVRSVIGRFLEHTRLNMFEVDAEQELFLSSADWMNRNMMRRVEIAWPIENKALRKRLIDECLTLYLQDNQDAWLLKRDGTYERVVPVKVGSTLLSAQTELLKKIQKSPLSAE